MKTKFLKKALILLFIGFLFTTCTSKRACTAAADIIEVAPVPQGYTVIPESPRPGEPVTIGATFNVQTAALFAGERRLARAQFFTIPAADATPEFLAAVFTVPSTASPGPAVIILEDEYGIVSEITITIAEREFASETINLTPALGRLFTEPNPQRAVEAERLWAILGTTGTEFFHTGKFMPPVTSTRRTSHFGTRRINRHPDGRTTTAIHAGIDFGIPTGTPVFASGNGKVVLASMRILSGNSVIIEHGPGIYSIYYHLDEITVQENDMVEAGDLIGLSGSTGFSTGPHLHWELRISGENTDPDAFLYRPIIDKELIISNIKNRD